MTKEIFDSLISIFPKLWNSLYIQGLTNFRDSIEGYKKKTLVPFLNDALEMSEDWKSMTNQQNTAWPENSQFNSDIPEEEKLKTLKDNIEFFKKNKAQAFAIPHSLHFLGSTRSYHETLNSELSIDDYPEDINTLPNHMLIATAKLKGTSKHLYQHLNHWNKLCKLYKTDQKPDSQARNPDQLEFDPYKVFYDQYLLF
jgi:hypothetical protein